MEGNLKTTEHPKVQARGYWPGPQIVMEIGLHPSDHPQPSPPPPRTPPYPPTHPHLTPAPPTAALNLRLLGQGVVQAVSHLLGAKGRQWLT